MRAPRVVGLFPILGWQGPPFRLEPSVPGTDHDSITGGKTGPTTLGQQSRQRRPLTHLSRGIVEWRGQRYEDDGEQ